jgi:hypothetical protein
MVSVGGTAPPTEAGGSMRVTLELSSADGRLEGWLCSGDGAAPVAFSGVLELLHAIEDLRTCPARLPTPQLDTHEEIGSQRRR